MRNGLLCVLPLGAVFLAVAFIAGKESLETAWRSHFTGHHLRGASGPGDYPFQPQFLWYQMEGVLAAVVGLVLVMKKGLWSAMRFPILLLVTVAVVHGIHRPWWSYYYLHLAIPIAWLAALAVGEAVSRTNELLSKSHYRLASGKTWLAVGLCLFAGFVLVRSEKRFEAEYKEVRNGPKVATDPVLAKMKEYASDTHWVFCEKGTYAFNANLSVPPELTVMVHKRFWSEQITSQKVVEILQRYQVEQLVLDASKDFSPWKNVFEEYEPACRDTNVVLYVAKRIYKPAETEHAH